MVESENRQISMDLYSKDNDIPLIPTDMTIVQYNGLDPTLSTNWVAYAKINGTIEINQENHQTNLASGEGEGKITMPVIVLEQQDALFLSNYEGSGGHGL